MSFEVAVMEEMVGSYIVGSEPMRVLGYSVLEREIPIEASCSLVLASFSK